MENKEQKWRKIAIGAGIAAGVVLVLLIALGIAQGRERAAYHAEMQRLEDLYASMAAAQDDSETSGKNAEVDMTDEYSYGGNAAANLYDWGAIHDGKLAKMMGDETVYYYADNSGNLYRKKLSDSEWEFIIRKEGAGKNIFNLNVDNIGGKYVYYEYEDRENDLNNGIYRLNVETLEEELLVSDEGRGKPREPRLMCGKLYYCISKDKKDSIYCMDLETLSKEMLFEPMEEPFYIFSFSVTGKEIIFEGNNDIFKLTPQGELSTIYNGMCLENVFVCGEYIFLTNFESEYIIPAFKLDFNGNVIETYDMKKERPHTVLTSVQGEDLYFFTYVENKKLLRMRMDSGEFEVVLEYPNEIDFNFVNIVDETMLLGFSKSIDGGKLEDLYALPVNSTDMVLEDCVHLCQEFTAK